MYASHPENLMNWVNLGVLFSTFLYMSFMIFRSKWMGRLASGIAGATAGITLLILVFKLWEMKRQDVSFINLLNDMSEVTALFSALAIINYLVMERVYRSKNAGWFVMLIISIVVFTQTFLINKA